MSLFCGAIGQNRDDLQVQTEPSLNFVLYFFDKKKVGDQSVVSGPLRMASW